MHPPTVNMVAPAIPPVISAGKDRYILSDMAPSSPVNDLISLVYYCHLNCDTTETNKIVQIYLRAISSFMRVWSLVNVEESFWQSETYIQPLKTLMALSNLMENNSIALVRFVQTRHISRRKDGIKVQKDWRIRWFLG